MDPLSCLCRYVHDLRIRHIGKDISDFAFVLSHCLIVLFNGVPLIDNNNHAFPTFVGNPRDLSVLLSHAFHRVDHHQHNVRPLHCRHRANNAVTLQLFFDLALSAKSCRINKDIFSSVMDNLRVNGVSRRTGNI